MNTIYQLPTWAETTLVICVAVMLAGLAALLVTKAIMEAINAEARLEHKRRTSDTKALNKWQKLYEEERAARLEDNSKLIAEIVELQCENKRMKNLLKRTKVAEL